MALLFSKIFSTCFFINIVFFNRDSNMLKIFTNPASKYTYLRTFIRANLIIWPTPEGSELVKSTKMNQLLKFVPSRLLISLT